MVRLKQAVDVPKGRRARRNAIFKDQETALPCTAGQNGRPNRDQMLLPGIGVDIHARECVEHFSRMIRCNRCNRICIQNRHSPCPFRTTVSERGNRCQNPVLAFGTEWRCCIWSEPTLLKTFRHLVRNILLGFIVSELGMGVRRQRQNGGRAKERFHHVFVLAPEEEVSWQRANNGA